MAENAGQPQEGRVAGDPDADLTFVLVVDLDVDVRGGPRRLRHRQPADRSCRVKELVHM
ncbi:hypothetical protein AB0N79_33730 [Streptomyces microflavus]|uniref:hypothetical protein n=1 Tax=Streptomyces microflavus TaxID=1919 RepID=UPI0022576B71|nr:hypothetical protein [Streptomyces microflavus]MCX4657451.1 hypothetical protein [Streptomyces microflavus]